MAREGQTKSMTGASGVAVTYGVNLLAPTPALELLTVLAKALEPALTPIFANAGGLAGALDGELGVGGFLGASLTGLVNGLDFPTLQKVIKALAPVTTVDGSPMLFELHFAKEGNAAIFQWLVFAVQVQFSDFFGLMRSAVKSAPRQGLKAKAAA